LILIPEILGSIPADDGFFYLLPQSTPEVVAAIGSQPNRLLASAHCIPTIEKARNGGERRPHHYAAARINRYATNVIDIVIKI